MSHHVFGDSGLGNLDTQFQQLAVNARRTQRGLLRLIIRIRSRTGCGTQGRPGLPQRILHVQQAEAFTMPGNHCCGLDDHQGGFPVVPHAKQPDPEDSISGRQFQPFGSRPPQDGELLPQGEVFQSQLA